MHARTHAHSLSLSLSLWYYELNDTSINIFMTKRATKKNKIIYLKSQQYSKSPNSLYLIEKASSID